MLVRCRSTVYGAGSTSNQHRPKVSDGRIKNDRKHSADIITSPQMDDKWQPIVYPAGTALVQHRTEVAQR